MQCRRFEWDVTNPSPTTKMFTENEVFGPWCLPFNGGAWLTCNFENLHVYNHASVIMRGRVTVTAPPQYNLTARSVSHALADLFEEPVSVQSLDNPTDTHNY